MEVYIVHKTTTETASVDPQSFFKCQKKEMKELKGQAGLSGLLLILRADILQVRVERAGPTRTERRFSPEHRNTAARKFLLECTSTTARVQSRAQEHSG